VYVKDAVVGGACGYRMCNGGRAKVIEEVYSRSMVNANCAIHPRLLVVEDNHIQNVRMTIWQK
jgi:hypothetical protein